MASLLAWVDPPEGEQRPSGVALQLPSFEQVYDENCVFVWRSLRGLGVTEAQIDDAVQEVFLVVLRKLPEYEQRGHIRSWLFAIALHVARWQRRQARSKPTVPLGDEQIVEKMPSPYDRVNQRQTLVFIERFAETLNDDQRTVFVLAEIQQMRVSEIAELLGENLNTVYSRHRAVRKQLQEALAQNPDIGREFMSGGSHG